MRGSHFSFRSAYSQGSILVRVICCLLLLLPLSLSMKDGLQEQVWCRDGILLCRCTRLVFDHDFVDWFARSNTLPAMIDKFRLERDPNMS
jgi:hypothetical protein